MRRPLALLTGFLGSGKTTLLNRLLRDPAMEDAAVIVNEFGAVGIDGLLVERVDEATVLLESGCVCCTVRGDLIETLARLAARGVSRAVVETTGLADPAPVAHTLMTHEGTAAAWHLAAIVATLDAVHGPATLTGRPEAARQVAMADAVVVTKGDLADAASARAAARALAPAAALHDARDAPGPAALFHAGPGHRGAADWLRADVPGAHGGIETFALRWTHPLHWEDVANAMDLLVQLHGQRLLRVKGLLDIEGHPRPVAIHGVRHLFHPPANLPRWSSPQRSDLVFITEGLARARVEVLLAPILAPRRLAA